jgi:hypothetical protein
MLRRISRVGVEDDTLAAAEQVVLGDPDVEQELRSPGLQPAPALNEPVSLPGVDQDVDLWARSPARGQADVGEEAEAAQRIAALAQLGRRNCPARRS